MDRQRLCKELLYRQADARSPLTFSQGRVASFCGPSLERYTSYRGHAAAEGPVKQFLFTEKGVLSISKQSVHYSIRRGITQWHLT